MVRVAFIHPDLGIGGAERLVVDAALALKSKNHDVSLFTAHHNPSHCFAETKDGTLSVTSVGDWLPRHFCHRGYAFWAYVRMIYVAVYMVYFSESTFDVIFCDQISACIPVLRRSGARVLYYCHFPDQLLQTERKSWAKKLYRRPLDWLEEKTTGMADVVLVNSLFTAQVFKTTFCSLVKVQPSLLYPSLNFSFFDQPPEDLKDVIPPRAEFVFLSINRYERKKNLQLALKAFSALQKRLKEPLLSQAHLVMAGGYDERVVENKVHYMELRALAQKQGIEENVTFVRSFTDKEKVALLDSCLALLYTPSGEHFGICPLEGMYAGKPVIAVSSGGPLETIVDGKTGFLCDPTPDAFAEKMFQLVSHPDMAKQMGTTGKQHVVYKFSFEAFTEKLNSFVVSGQKS